MYLGVKWEDSRIINMDDTVEDLQVSTRRLGYCFLFYLLSIQGVGFPFLSYLWQPDIEIHHVREVREPKVMGQFLAGLQINRGREREVLLSQVKALLCYSQKFKFLSGLH